MVERSKKIERSKLMRKKSSKLKNIQLNPSKAKGSLLELLKLSVHSKKKKKVNGVWYLALAGFFITVFVVGYYHLDHLIILFS